MPAAALFALNFRAQSALSVCRREARLDLLPVLLVFILGPSSAVADAYRICHALTTAAQAGEMT
jgi:hypothetical protein